MTMTPIATASLATARLHALLDLSRAARRGSGRRRDDRHRQRHSRHRFRDRLLLAGRGPRRGGLPRDRRRDRPGSASRRAGHRDLAQRRSAPARRRRGLDAVARVFAAQTRASGRVPQISIVLGPAAGGAAYGPALTDIVVLGPHGPDVRDRARRRTPRDRRGRRHAAPRRRRAARRRSGVVHVVTETDDDALTAVLPWPGSCTRRAAST